MSSQITREILESKIAHYNALTNQDLYLMHYWRQEYSWGLSLNCNTVLRGTKQDLYLYLDGAITAINTFATLHNIALPS